MILPFTASGQSEAAAPDSRPARELACFAAVGLMLATGGALTESPLLTSLGVGVVATTALWSMIVAPAWMLLGYIVLRPAVELAPTYERGPDVNGLLAALVLGATARWVWLHRGQLVRPHASVMGAGMFALAALLSVAGSRDPRFSLEQWLQVAAAVALFAVGDQISRCDRAFLRRAAMAIALSATMVVLPAIAQILRLVQIPRVNVADLDAVTFRPSGPYPAPTILAAHLVISAALLLLLVPSSRRHAGWRGSALPLTVLGVASMWALFVNKSRSPTAALLGVASIYVITRWRWRGFVTMTMVALAAFATVDTSSVRLDQFGDGVTNGTSVDTFQWRTEYWRDNLPRFTESPVTGIGLGRVEQLHPFHQPPHSVYVQTVVELGIVGSLALTAFGVLLARDLVAGLRRRRGTEIGDAVMLAGLLCGAAAFMGLFENLLTQLATTGNLALFTGAALGATASGAPARPPSPVPPPVASVAAR